MEPILSYESIRGTLWDIIESPSYDSMMALLQIAEEKILAFQTQYAGMQDGGHFESIQTLLFQAKIKIFLMHLQNLNPTLKAQDRNHRKAIPTEMYHNGKQLWTNRSGALYYINSNNHRTYVKHQ